MSEPEDARTEDYEARSERLREMPLPEVYERLDVLTTAYAGIEAHYSGPLGRFRRELQPEDLAALTEATGELLPFSMNRAVQAEIAGATPDADQGSLAFWRIGSLTQDIMLFLSRFENTGVTRVN